MASHDNTMENIPLETVVSHTPSHARTVREEDTEKHGLFHRGARGRRQLKKLNSKNAALRPGDDEEGTTLTRMGKIYDKILNFSIVTRYFIYVLPLALMIAVPIVIGATSVGEKAKIGGIRIVWFFAWIEVGKVYQPLPSVSY